MNITIYEQTTDPAKAELALGECLLAPAALAPEVRALVLQEAESWQLIETVKFEETLFWHNNDERRGSFQTVHSSSRYVAKDGHFYGMLFHTADDSSFGMSWHSEAKDGLVCIDGAAFGDTVRQSFRCSSEVDRTERGEFALLKK